MKGSITISRVRSNRDNGYVCIRVEDDISGIRFLETQMTLADFAEALLGLSNVECEFELRAEHVGKTREVKHETITIDGYSPTEEQKATALAPFEVDGWKAQRDDLGNHHKRIDGVKDGYRVTFIRFVENT